MQFGDRAGLGFSIEDDKWNWECPRWGSMHELRPFLQQRPQSSICRVCRCSSALANSVHWQLRFTQIGTARLDGFDFSKRTFMNNKLSRLFHQTLRPLTALGGFRSFR